MLAIPVMKSDPAGTVNQLGLFLKSQKTYPDQEIDRDLQKLEHLRRDALNISDASENGQTVILKYCAQLKTLAPRLSSLQLDLPITLAWFDAFATSKKATSSIFYLDLAALYWNLGAFESLLGGRVDRSTDDGSRTASRHFQQAAGYFTLLLENLSAQISAFHLPCLSSDSLTMCRDLMLSQAQLCFYEKAVRDRKAGGGGMGGGVGG
ncbi:hypothetical protein EON65_31325, partial [archaeon]